MTKEHMHEIALEIAKSYVAIYHKEYIDDDNPEELLIDDFIQVYNDAMNKLETNN